MPISEDPNTSMGSTQEADATAAAAEGQIRALQAEREKRQAVEKRLAEIESAAAAKAEAEAKQRGEFERLYTETTGKLTETATRLADYEKREIARLDRVTARNAERTKALPEAVRALVPGLDPDAVADWLDRAEPTLAPERFAAGGRGKPLGAPATPNYPPEAFEAARAYAADKSDEGLKQWISGVWLKTKPGREWSTRKP